VKDDVLIAVPLTVANGSLTAGARAELFRNPGLPDRIGFGFPSYDVAPDGKRFPSPNRSTTGSRRRRRST